MRPILKLPILCVLATSLSWHSASGDDRVSFNQQIRPILGDICLNCHGPDVAANEGGLRLDELEYAIMEGDSGEPAIVPGDSAGSELMRRLRDSDDPMPPADFEKQLTAEQIETLAKWIDEGAKYESHWAFTAPTNPAVPETKDAAWARNPIDQFILARLEHHGLSPSVEAEKSTLIRRLSLDLVGLPPTPAELDAFLADQAEDAYERLVDRLLMSPHFGERMAIPWLDYARYADSNGFQADGSRDIWAWRDWVINAYNRNLPFDEFTVEQLAGDMLPNPSRDQIIATGFNRNHRLNGEGGRIVDEWFVETVIDRVETTGLTWLGLTFNCCRCHDHKYDPISQREFFQMFAFFNSVEEDGVLAPADKSRGNTPPLYVLTTPEADARLAKFDEEFAQAKAELKEQEAKLAGLVEQWAANFDLDSVPENPMWTIVDPSSISAKGGVKFAKQLDGSYLASGKNPKNPTYEITIPLKGSQFTGLMVEAFPDPSLPQGFLGRSPNGNFVLSGIEMTISDPANESLVPVRFATAAADFEQPNWHAQSVLIAATTAGEKQASKGWATLGFKSIAGAPNRIMFVTERPVEIPKNATATIRLKHESTHKQHAIGRLRLQITDREPGQVAFEKTALPDDVREILAANSAEFGDQQREVLTTYFRANVPNPLKSTEIKIKDIETKRQKFHGQLDTTMVMKESKKRDAFILLRGEYDKRGAKVERGLPAFLPPMPEGQPMDRLGLANWIVDRSNPLTARVWVNRQWESLFGIGIVKTSENFGTQSDFPSHPALLDWLAVEFMMGNQLPDVDGKPAGPWDMKAMIKMMVMSAAYRQSSAVTLEQLERDPENRLISRGPRFRLTGELIRDQALAVSGLLKPKIGGPSVRPYMPDGVWDETSVYGNLRNYKADEGDGRYRRTMYTIWKRTAAPPSMLLFDAPNREVCTVKRSKTNTPLQALSLLNENTYVEAAHALAERMITEGGETPEAQVKFGFSVVTARQPTADELAILVAGLKSDQALFDADPDAAASFLKSVNESRLKTIESANVANYAAVSLTANVLLNLDEFVTRE